MSQMKEQHKSTERRLNRKEVSNTPDKEFKVMIIKILSGPEKRVEDLSEIHNKEIENIKKNQTEIKNSLNKIKSTLEEAE